MISIIIPTLNEEKILAKTIKSLRFLNIVNYEIIVSDGGSSDKTVEIAKKFADKVLVHTNSIRQTIAQGRNLGAKNASGDFLVFIDADVHIADINNFFKLAIELFREDSRLVGLTAFLKVLPEHVTLSDKLFFGIVNRIHQISNNLLHTGTASGEFQMIRRKAFEQIDGYNEKLVVGEDNDLFSRLSKIGRTHINTALYVWHTSRRAKNMGWPKLLFLWLYNSLHIKLFKRAWSKEWNPIR